MAQGQATMKAMVQEVFGGPEVLHFAEVPRPELRPRDLLIRVKAVSVNPVDTKVRRGGAAGQPVPGAPRILGWDGAGVVEALGSEAGLFSVGQEVYFAGDLTRAGSYAEFVAVDERIVGRKPTSLNFAAAAAVPLTALTAWEALIETMAARQPAAVSRPQVALIVGGAGGVGSIAIQVARHVCGLTVVATASRAESADFCRQKGAHQVIDHSQPLAPQLQELGLEGADYILNCADLSNFPQLVTCLKPLGMICAIVGGEATRSLDVSGLMPIRGRFAFELMFTRPRLGLEPEKQGQILHQVADLLDQGIFTSTMTRSLSWAEMQSAHQAVESGHTLGKIVLTVDEV